MTETETEALVQRIANLVFQEQVLPLARALEHVVVRLPRQPQSPTAMATSLRARAQLEPVDSFAQNLFLRLAEWADPSATAMPPLGPGRIPGEPKSPILMPDGARAPARRD